MSSRAGMIEGSIDHTPWLLHPDVGCRMAPKCLECPLEVCIEDEPWRGQASSTRIAAISRETRLNRDAEIMRLYREGVISQPKIAKMMGLHKRTVEYIISRDRKSG